jgi:phosphoribosylformimino-5-aminoimidazole carboxamide ribotide isomerase
MVDLEGAKNGNTPNIEIVKLIKNSTDLFVEIGGGIRDMKTVCEYLNCGVDRVILGTAAVTDENFLLEAVRTFGDKIAVGADVKDGYIAIKGWTEKSQYSLNDFIGKMQMMGVKTIICTDISKDGAMKGTNLKLYKELGEKYSLDIIASGGVSSLDDIKELAKMNIYGAIVGKAYYTGAIDLKEAIEVANDN